MPKHHVPVDKRIQFGGLYFIKLRGKFFYIRKITVKKYVDKKPRVFGFFRLNFEKYKKIQQKKKNEDEISFGKSLNLFLVLLHQLTVKCELIGTIKFLCKKRSLITKIKFFTEAFSSYHHNKFLLLGKNVFPFYNKYVVILTWNIASKR